jgi:hypothetical protein
MTAVLKSDHGIYDYLQLWKFGTDKRWIQSVEMKFLRSMNGIYIPII